MPDRNKNDQPLMHDRMEQCLVAGLEHLGQSLTPGQGKAMLDYLAELVHWNKAYNLTAVTDPLEMVDRHIIDSLSLRPFIQGQRILDAGTGAGLPGMVLAIAEPARHFILVDSNGKKIRFLRHVQRSLNLANVEPVHARLEQLELDLVPDEIVARALAPLGRMVEWLSPWLDQGTRLLAMKGKLEQAEIDQVPERYRVKKQMIDLPAMPADRCIATVGLRDSPK